MGLLQEMKKAGKTVFMVHHDLSSLREYFDDLMMINRRLIAFGPTEEVLTQENINQTFGKHSSLFEEVFQLSVGKKIGMRSK